MNFRFIQIINDVLNDQRLFAINEEVTCGRVYVGLLIIERTVSGDLNEGRDLVNYLTAETSEKNSHSLFKDKSRKG